MFRDWHETRATAPARSKERRRSIPRYRPTGVDTLEERLVQAASVLSVAAATGVYGGTAHLSATLTSASVPVANESVDFHIGSTDLGSVTTNASGVASLPTASVGSLSAGSYSGEVTASFAGDSTYAASSGSNGLTVNKAALRITASNLTKVYGQSVPGLTATYSGFVNGDTSSSLTSPVSLSTTAQDSSPVGTYPVTASGASSSNYAITYTAGHVSVTPATLTVTPSNVVKIYGVAVPTLTATYSGFVNGDTVASLTTPVTLSTTATTLSTFGNYTITSSGGSSPNYTIVHGHGTLAIPSDPGNTAFVTSLYQSILGRSPETGGLDGYLAEINNGSGKLAVIRQIYNSVEGAAYRTAQGLPTYANGPDQIAMITGMYEATIDRDVEPAGLTFWLTALNTTMNAQQVAAGIYASPEAVTDRAAGEPLPTHDQALFFVTELYRNILARNPETQGLNFWVDLLEGGTNASQITADIYNSVEGVAHRART